MNLMHPSNESRVTANQFAQKDRTVRRKEDRTFLVGETVYVKDFRASTPNKWALGTVLALRGPLSYTVQVGDNVWRRHIDQIRGADDHRTEDDPNERSEPGLRAANSLDFRHEASRSSSEPEPKRHVSYSRETVLQASDAAGVILSAGDGMKTDASDGETVGDESRSSDEEATAQAGSRTDIHRVPECGPSPRGPGSAGNVLPHHSDSVSRDSTRYPTRMRRPPDWFLANKGRK